MLPSHQDLTQQLPADVAHLMANWNGALIETLRTQPSMIFCANKRVLEAFATLFDEHASQHIYLKNPEDGLTDPPTEDDKALVTLVNNAIQHCRLPDYYSTRSDFYLYKNNTFKRLGDSDQIAIRTLLSQLLGPEYYLNELDRFWNSGHSATRQPRRTFIAQVVALLIQCEASLRFETASLSPASVALLRQLGTDPAPAPLHISHFHVQHATLAEDIALFGAFAITTWPQAERRALNPTVLYLPGRQLIEFDSPMALKTYLKGLLTTEHGRKRLLTSIAHRQHSAFGYLVQQRQKDAQVNLTPVTGVDNFFDQHVNQLIMKQRQDIEHHWAVSRSDAQSVMSTINQATDLLPLLDFTEAFEQHARRLLVLDTQRRKAAEADRQQLIQTQIHRLIDFDGVLTHLKVLQRQTSQQPLTAQFFTPHRQSPLYAACARAVGVLNKLKNDSEFSAWLRERPGRSDFDWSAWSVIARLINQHSTLEDSPLTRFTIQDLLVPLSEVPVYWHNDVQILIKVRRDIGDGIREDGAVRLDLALRFYGIDATTDTPLQTLIERVQERVATLSLDLPEGELPFDEILDRESDNRLQQRLSQRQRNSGRSIFGLLTESFLTPEREAQALRTPTVMLEQLFKTRQCIELGGQLAEAIDWRTAADEVHPAKVLRNLVWRALWLNFERPSDDARVTVAGENIATPQQWGLGYSDIRRQIERSLSHNSQLSPAGIQMALRLLKQGSASEIWVNDIPQDLHYATSIAWVNFKAGVALAQAIAPGSAQAMKFQQLLGLLATASQNATPEQMTVISLARLGPTLEWAKANGILATGNTELTPEQVQSAVKAFDQHEQELVQASEMISQAPPGRWRFSTDEAFDRGFDDYLSEARTAYQPLVRALLANLPLPDRSAIENGHVTLYALRTALENVPIGRETMQNVAAARGRHGFIIQAKINQRTTYYEVFPRAAVIRARPDIQTLTVNGDVVVKTTGGSSRPGKASFRLATSMPFDWNAYQQGRRPQDGVFSRVIAEQIGEVLPATAPAPSEYMRAAQSLSSPRSRELARIVANELFHTDEVQLRLSARRNVSSLDAPQETIDDFLYYARMLVPFWGGIEDIASGDPQRVESGALSVFTDLISFAVPIGKYVGGSARLIGQAGKIGFQAALPRLATLNKTFLLSALRELNPLEAVPSLLKIGGLSALRLSSAAVRQIDAGLQLFRKNLHTPALAPTGRTLQAVDPRAWKPLDPRDDLFTVAGVDHVPMRSVGTDLLPEFRLIDPLTNKIFGPRYIPMGEEGLQRLPDIDDYIAPVSYEQTAAFSRRANGIYDGKNQQSYARARGQWYAVETRYSLTGDVEFHIVHPHNKTRPTHRIVNREGVWTPVGETGQAGGKRLEELKKAKAEWDTHYEKAYEQMRTATDLLDQAAQSTAFNTVNLLFDKSFLHREANQELGLVHAKHINMGIFNPTDFVTTPDFGKSRLVDAIAVADNLGPRYAAVADKLEAYLEAQQKSLERLKGERQDTGLFKSLDDFLSAKRQAVNAIIEQTKVLKSLLDDELERMLSTLETLPARTAGPSGIVSPPVSTPPPPPARPGPSVPPKLAPKNRIAILIAGDQPRASITVLAKPRAARSDVADIVDDGDRRIATYIKSGEDKLWFKSTIQINEPSAPASSSQMNLIQELNAATRKMDDVVEEHDNLILFYRNKASAEPAGAEALIRYGAIKLNQGADDIEAACAAVTDEAARNALLTKVRHYRGNATRFHTMAKLVRLDLVLRQAPNANALAFLHSQPGILSIRKTLNRVAGTRQVQKPGARRAMKVPDFLDEFEIRARGNAWAYAHIHFEQAAHSIPARCHLKTPTQRTLGANAQTAAAREGLRLDIHRAEIYWPQARRVFYPGLAE